MPNHPQHLAFDTQMFGVPYGTYLWVHKMLDSGFAQIFGKKHRQILHDPESVEVIRQVFSDEIAAVCVGHIYLDSPTKYKIINNDPLNNPINIRLVVNKKR